MLNQSRNRNENPMIFNINRRNSDTRNGEVDIGAQRPINLLNPLECLRERNW